MKPFCQMLLTNTRFTANTSFSMFPGKLFLTWDENFKIEFCLIFLNQNFLGLEFKLEKAGTRKSFG